MKALLAFLLIPAGMLLHSVLASKFGYYEKWPVVPLGMIVIALIVLLSILLRSRPLKKGVLALNITAWVFTAFFLWWIHVYSGYPEHESVAEVGADISGQLAVDGLLDSSNQPFDLQTAVTNSPATLLVFYRGHW